MIVESSLLIFYCLSVFVALSQSAAIHAKVRTKRGILSKTGVCPAPFYNRLVRDNRLNFFGVPFTLPGDTTECSQSDCTTDHQCEGDRKCCRNHCGGTICTPAERDPHPCEAIFCPMDHVCQLQRVRCAMPGCDDMFAPGRPSCVPREGPAYYNKKRSRIPTPEKEGYVINRKTLNPYAKPYDRVADFKPNIHTVGKMRICLHTGSRLEYQPRWKTETTENTKIRQSDSKSDTKFFR